MSVTNEWHIPHQIAHAREGELVSIQIFEYLLALTRCYSFFQLLEIVFLARLAPYPGDPDICRSRRIDGEGVVDALV